MTETTPPAGRHGMFAVLAALPRTFWMANIIEMFERLDQPWPPLLTP